MTATKEKTTTTPALNEHVMALAASIEKGLTVDKTGVGTETGNAWKDNIPNDLTEELLKKASNYNADFVAAGGYAFGKLAVEAMAGNKTMERATLELKMQGRDKVSFNIERVKKFPNHLGDGAEIVKHGYLTSTYEVHAGKNSGQLKLARTAIADLAATALGGKK